MGILEKMKLTGKTAFVTGGARGIGKSVAIAFAQAGANVVIADFDIMEAEKTALEIAQAEQVKVIAVQTDVTDEASVNHLIDVIKQTFGALDIAFCNAGICMNIPAEEMTAAQWQKVINVNLTGVFLTSQAAGKLMIEQGKGGSIINTASMSAHIVNVPQPQCAYNASKAGVIQLTKSLAIEWAKYGIRVNSLSPGYIGTELTLNSESLQPLIKTWNEMAPLHRLGKPEELQSICVYLAGDTSSFTTGADFIVDGAFTCF
ncbi:SDR family oxidoreductase [Avibacterium paragallinarum]|uniref:SDR family oxidoreductase n=1 Tax=Avibacterium paragallinarum TaxID=728 RepID=A0AAE5THP4_AVIPA|nr:SDR family oxidoreductase [Avibacterium paragallinarum]MEE3608451.1 SDR family oxidoreductase [Avibacterium paragallinarum]MEE3620603.1 SDR family oxidoreductase [Avibacterium paragallinarum]MEE3667889.1 SDR family oxidoreductase [Avibacterium paragallinarum]MEE3680144.1 SDR family oxidoreductase [Avibacterium paragallinarum]MEE4385243.1 SDR family oxidoreductase [Avibacterium paragallinarum]